MRLQLQGLLSACQQTPRSVDTLSEDDIWLDSHTPVWKARKFIGSPAFYPVYQWRDLYSFSPLALILHKGYLQWNEAAALDARKDGFLYYSGSETVDQEVLRLGGPIRPTFRIRTTEEFVNRLSTAVQSDITEVESRFAGYTNIILAGGKDSENLALLPWKNPTVLLSAPPNYELNEQFVKENGLPYPVLPLDDADLGTKDIEILENCCRINLVHARFAGRLRAIAEEYGGKVIFWLGQIGDSLTTDYWKTYVIHGRNKSLLSPRLRPYRARIKLEAACERLGLLQRRFSQIRWLRGAMWQGSHMSIMKQATKAIILSAYHGKQMREVMADVDLHHAVKEDIRPAIGAAFLKSPVWYPSTNPDLPTANIRTGWSNPDELLKLLRANGIEIRV